MVIALVVLIALKLAGVIGWSWWWVFAPLWLGCLALPALALLLVFFKMLGG